MFAIIFYLRFPGLYAQEKTNYALPYKQIPQLEINPYIRWDKYPEFNYAINSASANTLNIKGTSWGINAVFKFPVQNKLYLKTGLGYYRYSFNKIDGYNSNFGRSEARIINYPSNFQVIYTSNKYSYNCISINVGIEQWFNINKNLFLYGSLNLNDFYTFSQYYRIVADYPTGPMGHRYIQHQQRNFGLSANASLGLLKAYHKVTIGPSIIIPIYDAWHKDQVFPGETPNKSENPSSQRSKWFNSVGIGLSLNYLLTKK